MDWYHFALFLHILGVLGLFMGLAVELASMVGFRRSHTVEAVRVWSSVSKPLAVIFPVMALLILGAGLYMTITVWGWGQAWINLSLGLLVLLSILGAAVNGEHAKRIAHHAALLGSGPVTVDLRHQLNHPVYWTSVITMAAVAVGIVFLMTLKPGLPGAIIALVCALVLGIILAQVLIRAGQVHQQAQGVEEQEPKVSTRV